MNDQKLLYVEEYNQFMRIYKTGQVSAEFVGELICKMAAYFSEYNLKLSSAQKKLFIIAQDIEARVDDNGKAISSAKAQVYVAATDENFQVMDLKCHLNNLEQFISALRSLLRGINNEYSYQSNLNNQEKNT